MAQVSGCDIELLAVFVASLAYALGPLLHPRNNLTIALTFGEGSTAAPLIV
jgi:hypothetical protein